MTTSTHTNNFSQTRNITEDDATHYLLPQLVTFCTYTGALTVLLSLFFNFLVLVTFFRRPRLITPFTVQCLNFVIIQLLTMLFDGPLNIAFTLNRRLFYNPTFCAFFKFGAWTFPALALLQQMAIGLDRWSAFLAPVWYRTKTIKHGVVVTLFIVAYYLVLYLPLFVIDTATGVPAGKRCEFHHAAVPYQVFVRSVTYYLPLAFMYVSYPCLLCLLRKRRLAKIHAMPMRASKCGQFMLI